VLFRSRRLHEDRHANGALPVGGGRDSVARPCSRPCAERPAREIRRRNEAKRIDHASGAAQGNAACARPSAVGLESRTQPRLRRAEAWPPQRPWRTRAPVSTGAPARRRFGLNIRRRRSIPTAASSATSFGRRDDLDRRPLALVRGARRPRSEAVGAGPQRVVDRRAAQQRRRQHRRETGDQHR
jgi:hypothetical protein